MKEYIEKMKEDHEIELARHQESSARDVLVHQSSIQELASKLASHAEELLLLKNSEENGKKTQNEEFEREKAQLNKIIDAIKRELESTQSDLNMALNSVIEKDTMIEKLKTDVTALEGAKAILLEEKQV